MVQKTIKKMFVRFVYFVYWGYKKELGILGSKSGRDGDKISEVGFTIEEVDNQPTFSQCKAVLVCKKMYQDDIAIKDMKEDIVKAMYQDGDQHTMYIAEIVGCYVNA